MALSLLAANNAQTVLAAGISSTATSLTVRTGTGKLFPSPVAGTSFFKLTIIDAATGSLTEIVHVTARAGDVFTIQREQEGTTARAWSANDIAANMMTAGTLSYILGNFQPLDPTLTALAELVGVANKLPYFNGNDTAALTDLTQVGRNIIGKNTIADILTYLGLTGALIGDECKIAGFDSSNVNAPYMRFARTNTVVPLATKDYAQPKDQTLTDLSGKDKAALRTYLDLKSAAQRAVGAGANQIPDMNNFTSSLTSPGWQKLPSGLIIQWGTANPSSTGEVFITFPVAFSAYPMYVGFGPQQVSLPNVVQSPVISAPTITNLGCGVRNLMIPTAGGAPVASMSSFFWIAVGK
ncbi:TPA: gp53-like domain-containing protein [Escherichia coli]